MARQDWYDREDEARRMARRRDRDDFGQADYSADYGYDADNRSGYRTDRDRRASGVYDFGQADYSDDYAYDDAERRGFRRRADGAPYDEDRRFDDGPRYDRAGEPRSWTERAGDFFTGRHRHEGYQSRLRRPSDRALWEVIVNRLERQSRVDLREVEVLVEDREVTLNGRVHSKADKRRIEDIADIDGVRHVQNNLRVREHSHWTFL